MKKIKEMSFLKKIALILIIITICCFIIPKPVSASAIGSFLKAAGGVLIDEVLDLFIFLGDCILNILQENFISGQDVIIEAKSDTNKSFGDLGDWLKLAIGIITILVGVCIAIASWGTLSGGAFAVAVAGIKIVGGVVLTVGVGGAVAVSGASDILEARLGKFDLPMIRYTPYEIFSGKIPVFDVNFIKPMESVYSVESTYDINDDEYIREYIKLGADEKVKSMIEDLGYGSNYTKSGSLDSVSDCIVTYSMNKVIFK